MKEPYNWWTDPKNAEEVERLSWWSKPENQDSTPFPIAVVQHGDNWVVTSRAEHLLGEGLHGSYQGDSKEEAIAGMFKMMKITYQYTEECRLKYQRWVPFRKGEWGKVGGNWFTIFGIQIYFRYGKSNKGGWFVPFTWLNISVSNDWRNYNKWKLKKQL